MTGDIEKAELSSKTGRPDILSIVTPAFNEAGNLRLLYEELAAALKETGLEWEWLIVDDHSADDTYHIALELAARDSRVRCFRLSRNSGSHAAFSCGLARCIGDSAVLMASDLQDPPSLIPKLVSLWQSGVQVVLAGRRSRLSESRVTLLFAGIYYFILRRLFGMSWLPARGVDFILIDRRVINIVLQHSSRNVHLFTLITSLGFRQESVEYDKQARVHGSSGWTPAKKLKLFVDSIVPFSYLPIRFFSICGFLVAFAGFAYAGYIVISALSGFDVKGWASLMVVILIVGGMIMMMLGVLGEYIWRIYDEARQIPQFMVEDEHGASDVNEFDRDPRT